MIRYEDALADIETAIEAESKGWLAKAKDRADFFRARKEYVEKYKDPVTNEEKTLEPFWSDIKPVYMKRQFRKCVYCEKRLEGQKFATVEWDLEHFRPKGNVRAWPTVKHRREHDIRYDFTTGGAAKTGYYLLAYHPRNYAAACKTCNSPFKSDYFPVAAARIATGDSPEDYAGEAPYLVYPLGQLDEDPEDLLRFDGERAEPLHSKATDERKWRRGQVMIDFFGLNRDGLRADRAWWLLMAVWPNVLLADVGNGDGIRNLEIARSKKSPFTNCVRWFLKLCDEDRPAAEAKVLELRQIVEAMEQ